MQISNIKLINFEEIEPTLLIVVKKIVGIYTKKISSKFSDFKSIEVTLENKTSNLVKVRVECGDIKESESRDKNLFFALDGALGAILNQ